MTSSVTTASWNGCNLRLVEGDITRLAVDAIVNAANSGLMGGGGVDGAVHRAGGPAILADCRRIIAARGRLPVGEAVSTTAGDLPAKRVIHTVGPVYSPDSESAPRLLANAYRSSLGIAVAEGLSSVAFPSISTGAYGYPLDQAARIALLSVRCFLEHEGAPPEVVFCLYGAAALAAYQEGLSVIIK